MKFSPKLLGKNEHVVLHLRTHIKALIPSFLFNVLFIVIAVLAFVYLPQDWRPTSGWVILAVTVTLVLIFWVWPWMNWLTSTYTVTNRRLITRTGVLTKTGHDIPLTRITDVAYEHSLLDRMFGCGTLVLQTSASEPLHLHDIPKVEKVHVLLTDMLFHSDLNQQDAYRRDPEESAPYAPVDSSSQEVSPATNYPTSPAPEPAVTTSGTQPLPPVHEAPSPQSSSSEQPALHPRENIHDNQNDPNFPLDIDDDASAQA